MGANDLKDFLLWPLGINYACLLVWSSAFFFGHDRLSRLLGRWFKLPIATE